MADHSKIQWTEATWNPVAGCRKVSGGCDHCYAIRDAHRLAGNPNAKVAAAYEGLTQIQNGRPNWTGTYRELPERLDQPLRWTRPRRIFVNSMSDLFGEGISVEFIRCVFQTMQQARQHQFQVLTKRPERMLRLLTRPGFPEALPNVWLGTSVEDQQAADQRVPALLQTPAAVRFLSCEPLLAPVRLDSAWLYPEDEYVPGFRIGREWSYLHWVILGGESGPGARPMQLDWARSLIHQCRAANVPVFVKQLGSVWAAANGAQHHKGGDSEEWPADLRLAQFPAER